MLSQVVIFLKYLHNVFMNKWSNLPSVSSLVVCIKGKESYVYKPIQARAHLKASSGSRQSKNSNVPNRSPSATTITTQVRQTHSNTTILIQVGIYHNKQHLSTPNVIQLLISLLFVTCSVGSLFFETAPVDILKVKQTILRTIVDCSISFPGWFPDRATVICQLLQLTIVVTLQPIFVAVFVRLVTINSSVSLVKCNLPLYYLYAPSIF